MLISTARYVDKETRELASAFAASIGSIYAGRGKKTVERLVSEARKKGENTLALFSSKELSFISISTNSWSWKKEFLQFSDFKLYETEETESGSIEGKDAPLFAQLFGMDSFYGGDSVLSVGGGKLKLTEEGKTLLEMKYKVITNEEQRGIDS